MNKKYYNLIIITIIIIFGFTLFKCFYENKKLKGAIPYLILGEEIDYFNLIGMDEKIIDTSVLKKNRHPIIIFIFSYPCSPCNKNILYWKKIAEILKDKVTIYGVILDNLTKAFNFSKIGKLNFPIYIPHDLKTFLRKLRIKLNFAQTIVYKNGVKYIKLGDLEAKDAINIIQLTKELN